MSEQENINRWIWHPTMERKAGLKRWEKRLAGREKQTINTCARARAHTLTHTHTHTHARAHARTHPRIHIRKHIHTHQTCISHTYTRAHARTHAHTQCCSMSRNERHPIWVIYSRSPGDGQSSPFRASSSRCSVLCARLLGFPQSPHCQPSV